jgi:hypothetical protein
VNVKDARQIAQEKEQAALKEKEAKLAAKKAAEEQAKAAKAAKEAEEEAKKAALAERANQVNVNAAAAFESKLVGAALTAHIKENYIAKKLPFSAAALLSQVLTKLPDAKNMKWLAKDSYGPALSYLNVALDNGNIADQVDSIYEIQRFCHSISFPKIDVKGEKRALVELIFQLSYQNDVIEAEGFLEWADDEKHDNIPGKTDALVQSTKFMVFIKEAMEEDDEEEEEDEAELGYEDNFVK